ncbi:Ankyrin repeat [Dillenia turbinata]|uniref:Ankyrin repeat n=1 Tax=Dillenia turbinata TaxID=194707 RepID=A0AAN8ZTL3_9MAGN
MDTRTAFSDSNDIISGGSSSICYFPNNNSNFSETLSSSSLNLDLPEVNVTALKRLSENLDSVFESFDVDNYFSDAKIILNSGKEVPIHRCILAARSPFFKSLFGSWRDNSVKIELKELAKEIEIGTESLLIVLGYMYSGTVRELPKGVCDCVDEDCSHVACRPAVEFLVEVLYVSFTFQISELVAVFQRHILEILDKVAPDDLLVILSVANICSGACERLLATCIEVMVKSNVDIVTLEKALPQHIVKQIYDSRKELGMDGPEGNTFPDKHVKRIHRALDSDDVELVRMLLKEGQTNLDEACALHYAVAYCDAKTTTELLDLALADINHRNARGYTVLHVAALRKEPKIIVSLLTKGACSTDLTVDGRKALHISKRLTKAADYYKSTEEGKASPKDKLCVEILEQAERRDSSFGEAAFSLAEAGDDLRLKLLYLENRVALARLLFPEEARVAMDIAQVDGTFEFMLASNNPGDLGSQRTAVNLNEAPFLIGEEHLNRLKALSRTGSLSHAFFELGKRFFPRCSDVLNKIMDADDWSQLAYLGHGSARKKQRYMELLEIVNEAFTEDKEEFDRSTMSSSSSSMSIGAVRQNSTLTLRR